MRMLQIHSDGFSYEAKRKAMKNAEEIEEKVYHTDDSCLVNFIASEKTDESNVQASIDQTTEMIASAADEVKERNIIVYPWVHLTETPSGPATGLKLLKGVAKSLSERGTCSLRMVQGF